MTNIEIAELLRKVAAAYQILNDNRFRIIAYERAADSIEHLTSELKDYWDDKKLGEIPGIGVQLAGHLDELFRTGHVKHFEFVLSKLPASIYPLLLVPGIGPKKAYKLVTVLKLKNEKTVIEELKKAAKTGKIAPIEGFGEKSQADILGNIETYRKGKIKENRMNLPVADEIAHNIVSHLSKLKSIKRIDVLGSLRRQASTVGDIDIAVVTDTPKEAIEHFLLYPNEEIIEEGAGGASIRLHNGRQVDLRVADEKRYGAMLQYFTGSKNHNIALRTFALSRGLSLSEYGIKHLSSGKVDNYESEEAFYKALGLSYIPPELREDKGEIEAAFLRQPADQGKLGLPKLVETSDIKGDLHVHTNYDLESSHDLGANPISDCLDAASELEYEYIGLSDHNPSISHHTEQQIADIMKRRKEWYQKQHALWEKKTKKHVGMFIMCEVDILPDGRLALPDGAFDYVDGVIVSLHSSFTQERKTITDRIIKGLTAHAKVRIFGHPTARLLGSRESVDADWKEVFALCKDRGIALEINAFPDRLDLPDALVFDAAKQKIPLCINTDAHAVDQMHLMKYGVSVARRGWATKHDIVNTLGYNDFIKWFKKGA
jgi:DNA polymerase (family 10)